MQLPFTKEQFFDLFVVYNVALWPVLIALWMASVAVSALLVSSRRPPDRWISALLAAHWAWSAMAYHAAFFTRINPAAWMFAALFLVQAALFLWMGVVRGRLSFARWRNRWAVVAWLLVAYSLAYPLINAVDHLTVWRIPTFGVPCPTTIFTAGLLMLATPRSGRDQGDCVSQRPHRYRSTTRIVPSALLSRKICPAAFTSNRRSARAAAVLPCATFFS